MKHLAILSSALTLMFVNESNAAVEIGCSHKLQKIGESYFSQASFEIGKTVVVEAFGELEDGSHWLPAKAEIQDLNGQWHSRMENINVSVSNGVYGSLQNWIPEKIGSTTDEFESVFGKNPAIRCSLSN